MAKAMGFVAFRTYPSDRFNGKRSFRYTHDGEEFVLEPAAGAFARRGAGPVRESRRSDLAPTTEAVIECRGDA